MRSQNPTFRRNFASLRGSRAGLIGGRPSNSLAPCFFDATTLHALSVSLSVRQLNRLVWTPDALGSACFLIASGLAWFEVCHVASCWRLGSLAWWITALNLLGSIAFGVSAIASYVVPTTGLPINVALVNLGTFVGALCFFIGAVLLLPERTRPDSD